MSIKLKFIAAMLLLASTNIFAEKSASESALAEAKSTGLTLESLLPSACYHSGQYIQLKTMQGLDGALKSSGHFVFSCEQGLLWHTAEPIVESIVYLSGGKQSIVKADGSAEALDGRVHRELGKLLNNLIGGNTDYLTKKFNISEDDERVVLVPKKDRMRKYLQSIEIIPQAEDLQIVLRHSESERTAMTISDAKHYDSFQLAQCNALIQTALACDILFQ